MFTFTGDGGFYYHLGELETAARNNINTIVIVNNNLALGQVKTALYVGDLASQWGKPEEVYAFSPTTDFARIADELGCMGIRVERASEIRPALERALAANRPVVADIVTDADATPPWSSCCGTLLRLLHRAVPCALSQRSSARTIGEAQRKEEKPPVSAAESPTSHG